MKYASFLNLFRVAILADKKHHENVTSQQRNVTTKKGLWQFSGLIQSNMLYNIWFIVQHFFSSSDLCIIYISFLLKRFYWNLRIGLTIKQGQLLFEYMAMEPFYLNNQWKGSCLCHDFNFKWTSDLFQSFNIMFEN